MESQESRRCYDCEEIKPLEEFHTRKGKPKEQCKSCVSAYNKKHYRANKEAAIARTTDRKKNDPDYAKRQLESQRRHYKTEKGKATAKAYREDHKAEAAVTARIRLQRIENLTPDCLTKEDWNKMNALYTERDALTESTGITHHVDHIFPLKPQEGYKSGQHAWWNLQVTTAEDNLKKSNKQPTFDNEHLFYAA